VKRTNESSKKGEIEHEFEEGKGDLDKL